VSITAKGPTPPDNDCIVNPANTLFMLSSALVKLGRGTRPPDRAIDRAILIARWSRLRVRAARRKPQ
jgi:hypothetical protein